VIVDPEKCTGCKVCLDACEYGAIFFNEDLNVAQKCTGALTFSMAATGRCHVASTLSDRAIKFGEESNSPRRSRRRGTDARVRVSAPGLLFNVPKSS